MTDRSTQPTKPHLLYRAAFFGAIVIAFLGVLILGHADKSESAAQIRSAA